MSSEIRLEKCSKTGSNFASFSGEIKIEIWIDMGQQKTSLAQAIKSEAE